MLSELTDGTHLTPREGTLARGDDGKRVYFTFSLNDKRVSVPLLPDTTLMRLEKDVAERGWQTPYRLGGTITQYGGRNYLLVEQATRVDAATTEP
jgi:hypothetical protein